jgi:hypothetical protein
MNHKEESLSEIERTFWEANQHLLAKENYPEHLIGDDGTPITPVCAEIPLSEGRRLISYQWPFWEETISSMA